MIAKPDQQTALSESLESAISNLEQLAKQKTPRPSRFHARDILIPLGSLLAGDYPLPRTDLREHFKQLTQPFAEYWERALAEEIQLATTEYVTSVDPRYLEMPNYDFDYTTSARKRLEARLSACDLLGHAIPEPLSQQITKADQIYQPFRDRYEGEQA